MDAPSNIERFSASLMDMDSLSGRLSAHRRGGSSVSRVSVVADHGSVTSGSGESIATTAAAAAAGTVSL